MLKIFRYWLPVILVLSLIFFLSSLPGDRVPQLSFLSFPGADKVQHFLIYCLLGFSICRALTWKIRDQSASYELYHRYIWLAVMVGVLYGASDEFHQSFVPGRDVEIFDFVADSLGACSGAFLTVPYRKWVFG